MKGIKDIKGFKSGKLTVIESVAGRDVHNRLLCKCKCECGNEITVLRSSVLQRHSTNCGCSNIINLSDTKEDIKNFILGIKEGRINCKIGATIYAK